MRVAPGRRTLPRVSDPAGPPPETPSPHATPAGRGARLLLLTRRLLRPVLWVAAGAGVALALCPAGHADFIEARHDPDAGPIPVRPLGPVKARVIDPGGGREPRLTAWHPAALEVRLAGRPVPYAEGPGDLAAWRARRDALRGEDAWPALGVHLERYPQSTDRFRQAPSTFEDAPRPAVDRDDPAAAWAAGAAADRASPLRPVHQLTLSVWHPLALALLPGAVRVWRGWGGRPPGLWGKLLRPWVWTAAVLCGSAVLAVVLPPLGESGVAAGVDVESGPADGPHPRVLDLGLLWDGPMPPVVSALPWEDGWDETFGPDDRRPGDYFLTTPPPPAVPGVFNAGGLAMHTEWGAPTGHLTLALTLWWLLVPAGVVHVVTLARAAWRWVTGARGAEHRAARLPPRAGRGEVGG